MRKSIEDIAIKALDSGAIDERIATQVEEAVKDTVEEAIPGAVAEKLPDLVASEFQKPDSPVRVTVANQVETIISDKIESGQIGGGSGGGNKPITPDKPVDPDPEQPDVPENPDEPQPPAVGKAEILTPVHGATGLDIPFAVTISDFSVTNDGTDTAKAVQLQVAKDSRFENIVFDSGQIAPTRQISVTSGVSFNEVVYLRARYIGNTLGEGPWSTFVGVTTRAVLIESDDFWDVMPDPHDHRFWRGAGTRALPQRRPHVRGPGHRRRGHLAGRRHGLHPPGPSRRHGHFLGCEVRSVCYRR